MSQIPHTEFADRQKAAAEARQALLAKFRPKPTVVAPEAPDRAAVRAAELARVRTERREASAAKAQAAAEAAEAVRLALEADAAAALDAKRGELKERKALTKAEAKAKRVARYAARKARA